MCKNVSPVWTEQKKECSTLLFWMGHPAANERESGGTATFFIVFSPIFLLPPPFCLSLSFFFSFSPPFHLSFAPVFHVVFAYISMCFFLALSFDFRIFNASSCI
mmetsp:Transcript_23910/g.60469  ORF Transcript_23910/g.60469 Transcript_23910/m.60469 type:complete len:104 (-) Transcript_23910:110-421(-)